MNTEQYVDSFFPAVQRVFDNMFQTDVEQEAVEIKSEVATNKVAVSIGVTGELSGNIIFSFPEQMSLDLVEEMAMMEVEEIDKFVTSAVGELANIISGHAMTNLSDQGYQCDIVPPQVMKGKNKVITMDTKEIISMPLATDQHEFEINISLQQK